jgi:hypothetical protein
VEPFAHFLNLDRLRDRQVFERALLTALSSMVWEVEGFALASGYDEKTQRYVGLAVPGDSVEPSSLTDSVLVVRPEVALSQRELEAAE